MYTEMFKSVWRILKRLENKGHFVLQECLLRIIGASRGMRNPDTALPYNLHSRYVM